MTRAQILAFLNDSLLDGRDITSDAFGVMLPLAKAKVEGWRPWVKLRAEDSSGAIAAGNAWTTAHSLPTRFARPWPVKRRNGSRSSLVIVRGTEVEVLTEIEWAQRLELQSVDGYYAIDYANSQYIVTGSPRAGTPYWSFIKFSPELTADSDTWIFPEQYHAILAYIVAAMEKARDWDEVNMANIELYVPEAADIMAAMVAWDDQLQRSMLGV